MYLVCEQTTGGYLRPFGIFSSKEKAEKAVKTYQDTRSEDQIDLNADFSIYPFEIDEI
jgi:hypothetical protein